MVAVQHEDKRVVDYINKNVDRSNKALITIDCIPKVDPTKVAKLTDFLKAKIKKETNIIPSKLRLPTDEAGVTEGFALAAFETAAEAEEVCKKLNGAPLDKQHKMKTNMFSDWDRYKVTPDEYVEPSLGMDKFQEENLYEYLCDEGGREQFFMRYSVKKDEIQTRIYWNDYQVMNATDQKDIMVKVHDKPGWAPIFAKWSPLGTYFVTFAEKGLTLWGGERWTNMGHFPHTEVQHMDWSPKERYLITWASELIVWDVQLGKKIRRIQVPYTGAGAQCPFKWSHDEQFLAKLSEDTILLYDLEKGMKLYQPDKERSTIYMPGVKGLEWSPTDNYFCFWVPQANNTPARVSLWEVITKVKADGTKDYSFNMIAQRNLYRVQNIRMTWHPQGDFLACKVERVKKSQSGNTTVSAYELFRIRHKDRAVETIEIPEQVISFDFEPKGHRFCLIHGPSEVKLSVSFYTMGGVKSGEVKLLGTFAKKEVNRIYWSPKGKYLLLAGMQAPFNGKVLEFWNVDELNLISEQSHVMCTNVNWDPSGRFVTTFVPCIHTQGFSGMKMWTFQGKIVVEYAADKFYQFEWRPRPPSLLTEKDLRQIKSKARRDQWEKKYQEEEVWILEKDERERKERMHRELKSYSDRVAETRKKHAHLTEQRRKLQLSTGVCFDYKTVTTTVEELVEKKETKLD